MVELTIKQAQSVQDALNRATVYARIRANEVLLYDLDIAREIVHDALVAALDAQAVA